MRWTKYVAVGLVAVGLSVMTVATPRAGGGATPAVEQAQAAQDTGAAEVTPESGFFIHRGGFVRGKVARTQTAPTVFSALFVWLRPSPTLSTSLPWTVASGTTDLFNVTFSGECQKFSGGQLRIRVLDNGIPMEPYDGFQVFCSSSLPATYTGTWVRRVGAGAHSIQVQFLNSGGGAGVIDDWTFELVVHD